MHTLCITYFLSRLNVRLLACNYSSPKSRTHLSTTFSTYYCNYIIKGKECGYIMVGKECCAKVCT